MKTWNLLQRKEMTTFTGHDDLVLCVAISPDGETVASGGWDNTIWIWEFKTGKKLRALKGHKGSILKLAFSPDGKWLASSSEDRTARLWEVDTGIQSVMLPAYDGNIVSMSFQGEGHAKLVAGNASGIVRQWDFDRIGQREEISTLRGHDGPVTMFDFGPRKSSLVISGSVDRTIRLWRLQTGESSGVLLGHLDNVTAVKFSPDGEHAASASRDSTVRIWNIRTGSFKALNHSLSGKANYIRDISYSPDGNLLASVADDGRIRIWDALRGELLRVILAHEAKIQGVAFSRDGKLLGSASDDGTIKLWAVDNWTQIGVLSGHRGNVFQIVFSPDGQLILSASDDMTARLWDVKSGKELGSPIEHNSPVWTVDFSPDGRTIATGCEDWTVHLWDIELAPGNTKLANHRVLRVTDGPVWYIKFSRDLDEPLLGISGQDKTIRLLKLRFLKSMFANPARLEAEAEQRSGFSGQENEFNISQ